MKPKQNCGSCRWAVGFRMTKHNPPRFAPGTIAKCLFEIPTIPLPDSLSKCNPNFPYRRCSVIPTDGKTCPCWSAKEDQ